MRNILYLFLILLVCFSFYFLGKKNGANNVKISMVENVDMIKEIAELAALDITGNVNLKISNKGDENGSWNKLKNYFTENTLMVSIPYESKFGVDMSNQKMQIDTKENTVVIRLPSCKLLSMQLKIDKMETMAQTGIFNRATMDDLVNAQKQLYTQALQKIENDKAFLALTEKHIKEILQNYYKPLGYKVTCIFAATETKG